MQIYSITSGKGGVGKTSLICNMAFAFAQQGRRVLLIDADLGLANVDIVMGLRPQATLADFFAGDVSLDEVLVEGPAGIFVLPAASGVQEMSRLSNEQVLSLMAALEELPQHFDVLLVDTGAGIGDNVLTFNAAARAVLVVATAEPTSMTDAYAVMKTLAQRHEVRRFQLIVNQVADRKEALRVYRHLTTVADQFMPEVAIDYLGFVVRDPNVSRAVVERTLLAQGHPDSPAAVCIAQLVQTLDASAEDDAVAGNLQFFWRRLAQPSL